MLTNKKGKDQPNANVIVRKKLHAGDTCHHGGVWKIAYADFMTAMMTFFLVMWLINSSSKEKITQIASYFNPIQLNNRVPAAKGIGDNQKGGVEEENTAAGTSDKKTRKTVAKPDNAQHQAEDNLLFRNPFGVLTQLASQAEGKMAANTPELDNPVAGGSSHDPFVTDPMISEPLNRISRAGAHNRMELDSGAGAAPTKAQASLVDDEKRPGPNAETAWDEKQADKKSGEAASKLEKDLTQLIAALPQSFRPNIVTKATSEGVLVTITDDLHFSMFKIASAEPSPQLVIVLERIGNLINKYPGKIIVRGHTDARPYAGDHEGNWRLSVDRARMTYYMLLRGKVDENRFLALEGYADRSLKNIAEPRAAENRRIEILLRGEET